MFAAEYCKKCYVQPKALVRSILEDGYQLSHYRRGSRKQQLPLPGSMFVVVGSYYPEAPQLWSGYWRGQYTRRPSDQEAGCSTQQKKVARKDYWLINNVASMQDPQPFLLFFASRQCYHEVLDRTDGLKPGQIHMV